MKNIKEALDNIGNQLYVIEFETGGVLEEECCRNDIAEIVSDYCLEQECLLTVAEVYSDYDKYDEEDINKLNNAIDTLYRYGLKFGRENKEDIEDKTSWYINNQI